MGCLSSYVLLKDKIDDESIRETTLINLDICFNLHKNFEKTIPELNHEKYVVVLNEINYVMNSMDGYLNNEESLSEVEVKTLPRNLPESISVDVQNLAIGDVVHLSDLKLPKGVTITALEQGEGHDQAVASITEVRKAAEDVEAEAAEAEVAEAQSEEAEAEQPAADSEEKKDE